MFRKQKKDIVPEREIRENESDGINEVNASELIGSDEDKAVSEANTEESIEAMIGRSLIECVMQNTSLEYDEAAKLLFGGDGFMPSGNEMLSAKAAQELSRLVESGEFTEEEIEQMIEDPEFIKMLCEMPLSGAIKVQSAQKRAKNAEKNLESERKRGEDDIIEKLKSRRALPQSTRNTVPVSPEIDYAHMSSKEFSELKKKLQRAMADGIKVKI